MKVSLYFSEFIYLLNLCINAELKNCEQQCEAIKIENEDEVSRYYKLKKNLEQVQEKMMSLMNEPKYLLQFLQPGRLVTVSYAKIESIIFTVRLV